MRLDGGGADPEVACSRTVMGQNSMQLGGLILAGKLVAVQRQPGSAFAGSLQAADAWLCQACCHTVCLTSDVSLTSLTSIRVRRGLMALTCMHASGGFMSDPTLRRKVLQSGTPSVTLGA